MWMGDHGSLFESKQRTTAVVNRAIVPETLAKGRDPDRFEIALVRETKGGLIGINIERVQIEVHFGHRQCCLVVTKTRNYYLVRLCIDTSTAPCLNPWDGLFCTNYTWWSSVLRTLGKKEHNLTSGMASENWQVGCSVFTLNKNAETRNWVWSIQWMPPSVFQDIKETSF